MLRAEGFSAYSGILLPNDRVARTRNIERFQAPFSCLHIHPPCALCHRSPRSFPLDVPFAADYRLYLNRYRTDRFSRECFCCDPSSHESRALCRHLYFPSHDLVSSYSGQSFLLRSLFLFERCTQQVVLVRTRQHPRTNRRSLSPRRRRARFSWRSPLRPPVWHAHHVRLSRQQRRHT